jgi:general stress protein 26
VAALNDIPDELTVKKIHAIVKTNSVCLFATGLSYFPLQTRPMNTQYADSNGSLWFFSNKDSAKNEAIRTDARVQLFYVDPEREQYVSIYGQAQILFDREKIDEFWNAIALRWFTGKDDPQISLIKVSPENIMNWDITTHKMALTLPAKAGNEKTKAKASLTIKDKTGMAELGELP